MKVKAYSHVYHPGTLVVHFLTTLSLLRGCQIEPFLVTNDTKDHLLLDKGAMLGRDRTQITGVCSSTDQKRATVAAIQTCHSTDLNYNTLFEIYARLHEDTLYLNYYIYVYAGIYKKKLLQHFEVFPLDECTNGDEAEDSRRQVKLNNSIYP